MKKLLSIMFIAVSIFCLTACEKNEPNKTNATQSLEGTLWVCGEYGGVSNPEQYIDFMENGKVKIWADNYDVVVGSYFYEGNKISFSNCLYHDNYDYYIYEGDFSSNSLTIYYYYKYSSTSSSEYFGTRVYIRK